jgi:WD40 repeat protein
MCRQRFAAVLWLMGLVGGGAAGQDLPRQPMLVLDAGGHTAFTCKVLFAPDGRELITVSRDKTIRFWDVRSGEPLRVLRPPIGDGLGGAFYTAALSPDGGTLAVGGYGVGGDFGRIILIALSAGKIQRVLSGHRDCITALAFSPDGLRLASGSFDRTARIWDVATGDCRQVCAGHAARVGGVAFSPDGRRLATGSPDRTARIWSVATGTAELLLPGNAAELYSVAWSPDGRTIAATCGDQSVRLWSPDGTFRGRIGDLDNNAVAVAFSPDSSLLLVTTGGAGAKRLALVFDVATGGERLRFAKHNNTVQDGAFSPDGALVATSGGDDHETYLWKAADGSVVHRLASKGRSVWNCAWGPDSRTIAWGDTRIHINTPNNYGPLEQSFRLADLEPAGPPGADFREAQVSRGSTTLRQLDYYRLAVQRGSATITTFGADRSVAGRMRSFTLFPGDRVAAGCDFGLFLLDIQSGKRLRRFRGHLGEIVAVAPSPDGRYLLSGSLDQTLRIWDPDREEPLVSLFFAGDEWVAWTPEGYYAASPGGERLMGWHVNNGPNRMASYYPAAQFHKSLYRPDVIKLLLQTGSSQRALELADDSRHRLSQFTSVEQVLPPRVVITAPAQAERRTSRPAVEISAEASPAGSDLITGVRLLLDGRPYGEEQRIQAPQAAPVHPSWTVTLTPGVHQIAVKADTAKSSGVSSTVEVEYAVEQAATELPAAYVLAVGISAYEDKSLDLSYGAIDAQGLAEAFQKSSGPLFRKVEVKVIVDAQATRAGILRGLEWLKSQMTQHDVGIFFYAGHGAKDTNGLFHLVPADCGSSDLGVAGISEDQIKRYCQSIPGRLMLLLDACHTGALGGDKRRAVGGLTDDLLRDLLTDDYGVIVMCSSMGREESQEQASWGHGAFTKALIEGLQGSADFDRDGAVYLNELDLYVTERVKALTGGRQHPVTQKPTTIRSFPLAKPWAGLKPPATTPR